MSLGIKENALKTFKSTTKLKLITSSSEIGVFYNFMFVILGISLKKKKKPMRDIRKTLKRENPGRRTSSKTP